MHFRRRFLSRFPSRFSVRRIIVSMLAALFIFCIALFVWISYPSGFTKKEVFLARGTFPKQISETLEEQHVVRSAFVLHVILKLRGTDGTLVPGKYLFDSRQSVFTVASRITKGKFGTEQMKVTIPEGSTNEQIAELISARFPDFDKKLFLKEASGKQGYLFPNTYYFISTSTEDIILQLNDTFDYNVRELEADAISKGKEWREVVTMASLLEEEADTPEDFRIISGILWKRLSIGIALQLDAAPITYQNAGFPYSPISNPGLETIEAALNPVETSYLYYLTGKDDGLMHYAVTFEEHKRNIEKYLK